MGGKRCKDLGQGENVTTIAKKMYWYFSNYELLKQFVSTKMLTQQYYNAIWKIDKTNYQRNKAN